MEYDTIARLIVFVDKRANQQPPSYNEIMQCSFPDFATSDVYSFRNQENIDRFEILHDQNFRLSFDHIDTVVQEVVGESVTYHRAYHRKVVDVSVNIRCNIRVEYAKESPPEYESYTNIIKNSIGSFWVVEREPILPSAGPLATHRGHWRIKYTDT